MKMLWKIENSSNRLVYMAGNQLRVFLSHCDQTGKVTGIVLEGALC